MDNYRNRNDAPVKKYNLSLKNRIHNNQSQSINSKWNITNDTSDSRDSQNFQLRVSDSFNIDDSDDDTKPIKIDIKKKSRVAERDDRIIIISDSSDNEDSSDVLPRGHTSSSQSSRTKNNNNNKKRDSSITMDSIEVSDEDDEIFTGSLTRKKATESSQNKSKSHSSLHYTSNETNFELKINEKDDESVIETSYTTPVSKIRQNQTPMNSETKLNTSERLLKATGLLTNTTKKIGTPGSTKLSQCTTPISKRDAKKIMKIIRSKKIQSPVVSEKKIINDTDSESVVTDEEPDRKVIHPAWIDDSDNENSSIPKPSKTHVTRFLNPPDNTSDPLSDEKTKEISRWLMNNSPHDRSDDSLSNISASNRNSSISSGHRSLERLEVNYETPNNRQKFREKSNTKIPIPSSNSPRLTKPTTPAQTLMDDYLKKTKSNNKPKNYPAIMTKSKTVGVSPAVDTPKARINDCADILDQLYGETWREKAAVLLPTTEPKRQVQLKDRGVQTECIRRPRKLLGSSENSSNDEGVQRFIKDMPNVNSSKRFPPKYKYRDSFIIHSSESEESTGDTTYMTALTNPISSVPKNPKPRETPMTLTTRRAIEICDSDSNEETPPRKNKDNRKKLVFSDDDNDQSSDTSEYDPDDIVPPKTVIRRTIKPLVNKSKIPTRILLPPKPRFKPNKQKSFLESLSSSVPIENCHQDAKKYRLNFKNTKDELVKVLYKMFNEQAFENKLPPDMSVDWNVRLRGTAGYCHSKKIMSRGVPVRTSRIELSTKVCDTADRIRDTLVHEMCHAATWLVNEVSDGHGRYWKAWAVKAMRAFPELPPVRRCHDYKIATKFTYRCMQCGYSIGRHSKSLDLTRKRCGKCYGRFELLINRVTRSGTMKQIPKTPANTKQPTAFALYVKENYSAVKNEQRGRPHKEVMQLLGQQFSAIKLSKQNKNDGKSPEESP